MKTTLFAALGALVLAAGGAPAMAGGYWDGGFVHEGPPPADTGSDECCPCGCRDDQDYRDHERDWREHEARGEQDRWSEREGWRGEDRDVDEDQIYTPMEFDGGVGPATFIDEGGGGSGASAGANGIAVASAFASASASVDVNVDIRERERMRHDHDMHHMMQPYPPKHDQPMHGYPPPMHDHQPMQNYHQPMMPMKGWGGMGGMGNMGGYHAMPSYHAPMMMHRSGGGRRW